MNNIVFEANKKIESDIFDSKLQEFQHSNDKKMLINKYKNHNMRFLLIIAKNIALERNEIEYANFIDSIICAMTKEISLLNNSFKCGNLNTILKKHSLHDKINIIFYVRPEFYDIKYEPYEILNGEVFKILSQSITDDVNNILKKYNVTLKDIKSMNVKDVHDLIKDKELLIDVLYATELINN